jgi:hypothetical protein
MSVEDRLIGLQRGLRGRDLRRRRMSRIDRDGQATKFQQTRHQQHPCLGRCQVRSRNEERMRVDEAFRTPASYPDGRQAREQRSDHDLLPQLGRHCAIGHQSFEHEAGRSLKRQLVHDERAEIRFDLRVIAKA